MLNPERFPEFFHAVHGQEPFPWQRRLAGVAASGGKLPDSIAAPTSAGKTAVLDCMVFALACGARVPRRIIHVVDRRLVVDEAHRRAEKIRLAIIHGGSEPTGSILRDVHDGLLACGGESPLETALLRGGLYQEDTWVRHPAQPLLVCSTVDQVGSRLLHQGYGVSQNLRSIHAGLLANDSLIILDEAHCSEPFRQTVAAIAQYRRICPKSPDTPFGFMVMTATPSGGGEVFGLDSEDRAHPVLSRRLTARKRLELVAATKPKEEGLVAQIVATAKELAAAKGSTILVVVNRVATARRIATQLAEARRPSRNALAIDEPMLLTGRSRPVERDRLLAASGDRLFAGRDRAAHAGSLPLIVVATQCVEVGADIDADALITEACPLDSLRQRLGRLDRLGELGKSRAILVAPLSLANGDDDSAQPDLIYGTSVAATWRWLKSVSKGGCVEAGIDGFAAALGSLGPDGISAMRAPAPDAPLMFPAYCDLWAQTSPEPAFVPDPALFLHGIAKAEAEAQIVWRADLSADRPETWAATIAACPPASGEALRVPLSRAIGWLERKPLVALAGSDIEGEEGEEETPTREKQPTPLLFIRWRGPETTGPESDTHTVRPGDTIVVPASSGGCDAWGWAPEFEGAVTDIATIARWRSRRSPVLRIHGAFMESLPGSLRSLPLTHSDQTLDSIGALVMTAILAIDTGSIEDESMRDTITSLAAVRKLVVEPHPSGEGWIVTRDRAADDPRSEAAAEDDGTSQSARVITLKSHTDHVASAVDAFSRSLGLAKELQDDLRLAAKYHDLGKADPRFQALLWDGDRIRAIKAGLLAKSPRIGGNHERRRTARRDAGYPEGGRHELLSAGLAAGSTSLRNQSRDYDLVLHIVASHHGRCRPFAPVVDDPKPRKVALVWEGEDLAGPSDGAVGGTGPGNAASGIAERYWSLTRKYGWWGLSYLEACFRLADHRASEMEEKGES